VVSPMPPSSAPASDSAPRQSPVRTALAGIIGNVLEWFDFGVYGFFASEISSQFFPGDSPVAQRIKGFLVFAIGFIGRPIGASCSDGSATGSAAARCSRCRSW